MVEFLIPKPSPGNRRRESKTAPAVLLPLKPQVSRYSDTGSPHSGNGVRRRPSPPIRDFECTYPQTCGIPAHLPRFRRLRRLPAQFPHRRFRIGNAPEQSDTVLFLPATRPHSILTMPIPFLIDTSPSSVFSNPAFHLTTKEIKKETREKCDFLDKSIFSRQSALFSAQKYLFYLTNAVFPLHCGMKKQFPNRDKTPGKEGIKTGVNRRLQTMKPIGET